MSLGNGTQNNDPMMEGGVGGVGPDVDGGPVTTASAAAATNTASLICTRDSQGAPPSAGRRPCLQAVAPSICLPGLAQPTCWQTPYFCHDRTAALLTSPMQKRACSISCPARLHNRSSRFIGDVSPERLGPCLQTRVSGV